MIAEHALPSISDPDEPHIGWRSGGAFPGSSLDCHVLVLNKLYQPVRIVSARRAFVLLSREIAEVIDIDGSSWLTFTFGDWLDMSELWYDAERERHDWTHTVRLPIAVPRIIRLLEFDRVITATVNLNRRNIFARDAHRCQYCGKRFRVSELTLDHVVPRSQGGGDSWTNLVTACAGCNAKKGGRTPAQANMPLIRKPFKPKRSPLVPQNLSHTRYASWETFLG